MRLVGWNCCMALHRKFDAVLRLRPDIAIVCECAEPKRLMAFGRMSDLSAEPVWIGNNRNKGLAVFAFNDYSAQLVDTLLSDPSPRGARSRHRSGRVQPARRVGAKCKRRDQPGTRARAAAPCAHEVRGFLSERPSIVAGDFNNNVFWHRPGWRINHLNAVAALREPDSLAPTTSFAARCRAASRQPTLYWRDRKKDGPTYHIDYVFLPSQWLGRVHDLTVGTYEDGAAPDSATTCLSSSTLSPIDIASGRSHPRLRMCGLVGFEFGRPRPTPILMHNCERPL